MYNEYIFVTKNTLIVAFSITVVVEMQYCIIYFCKVQVWRATFPPNIMNNSQNMTKLLQKNRGYHYFPDTVYIYVYIYLCA